MMLKKAAERIRSGSLTVIRSLFQQGSFSLAPVACNQVVESMADGVIVVDGQSKLREFNASSRRIFGWTNGETRKPILSVLTAWPELARQFQSGESGRLEIVHERNGIAQYYEVTLTLLNDGRGRPRGRLAVVHDITERKVLQQKLELMVTHDGLTGLPGRVLLIDRVEMAIQRARRNAGNLALIMLDLDRFKAVNDTLGHSLGNSLLKAVADRLKDSMRKNETVARWGGDEFVILLPEIRDVEEAISACGRLLFYFRNPLTVESHTLHVKMSLGIALYPQDGESFEELFEKADSAMYRAKRSGLHGYELAAPRSGKPAAIMTAPQ